MEIVIALVVFVGGLSAESFLLRHRRRRPDERLHEYRLARHAGPCR
jgi:hypothetical protein